MFRMNLIRDRVPGPTARRRHYLIMVGYLAVAGTALILTALRSTERVVDSLWRNAEGRWIYDAYALRQGKGTEPEEHLERLRREIDVTQKQVHAIERAMGQGRDVAPLVLGLVTHLPGGSELLALELDRDKGQATFEVRLPAADREEPAPIGGLVEAWRTEPLLQDRLRDTVNTSNRREGSNASGRWRLRFEAQLVTGGA